MPSAANAKSEKPASSEATGNSPIRQIMTIIEHKIRNLEKRKSKLTSYRDLQKAGKELNSDQKVAVAKYDEVVCTLEFARDLSAQVTAVATASEREAKKQAKKEAWVRYAAETNKIREVLLILDCLVQMGNNEAREDFLNGNNGASKLTEQDLKILDDLYPEVTPKHDINEEGQAGFHIHAAKAAEHLYAIIDGKPKDMLGTTYTHIKEIVSSIHECGYFDKTVETVVAEVEENCIPVPEEELHHEPEHHEVEPEIIAPYPPPTALPVPPAPAVVPAPAYPLRPLPPITLQEVEHAYFAQQYPQQRPISEVIGSQNFFFLQESEIDSPVGTPQPMPPMMTQPSPPGPIPTQTFTNQHFVQIPGRPEPTAMPMPPQPHFPPPPDHPSFSGMPMPGPIPPQQVPAMPNATHPGPVPIPQPVMPEPIPHHMEEHKTAAPVAERVEDEWKGTHSPEREDGERKTQGQGDGQNRFRRYNRGRGTNGYRGRGGYQGRQNSDGYQNKPNKDGYQSRQYDGYERRHGKDYHSRGNNDGYYGNGDTGDQQSGENGGRERYSDNQSYGGGFKSRGRGGARGGVRGSTRPPRPHHYHRKQENVE